MSLLKKRRFERRRVCLTGIAAFILICGAFLAAQTNVKSESGQRQDEDFAKTVREWTTRPEFLGPLVDHLPRVAGIPSPKDVLGHHVGEPKTLTYYADLLKYYRALADASPRVKVIPIGASDEGRECAIVFVGSEESIAGLEKNRAALARLADPRGLSEKEAREIVAGTKPLYLVMAGLHCNEPAACEMLMELAYRLAAEDSPLVNSIRDNVIVSLMPSADPDGRDRFVDWHYAHKIDETDEALSYGDPPMWGKYVRHDNNRDINFSQRVSKAVLDWYLAWHPQIIHDLHESVAFMFTFSGQDPQHPVLDPIQYGELPWFANFEMAQMTKYGMPGVWTHGFADMWYPGYFMSFGANHNSLTRYFETFSNFGANTMKLTVGPGMFGHSRTTREWYRPWPAYKEVVWSLRNNVNYAQTGVLTALQLTAAFPEIVLENFYRKSRNSVEAGMNHPPHGYVIPAGQKDATRVAFLVNNLLRQGIEVGRTRADLKIAEGDFAAGSYLVKLDQPYGRLARILLEKQVFPADPNLRTYDDTGWTMGLADLVDVREIADKAVLDAPAELIAGNIKPAGSVKGAAGPVIAVAHNGSARMITLRSRLKRLKTEAAEQPFTAEGLEFPAGSLLIRTGKDLKASSLVTAAVEDLGLAAAYLPAAPEVLVHDADLPRLAVYSIWGNTKETGWMRFTLDQYEVAYDLIYKERVRAGNLRAAYDVIVMPSQGLTTKGLVYDLSPIGKPVAYKKSDKFKSLGMYGESDDITGGMGLEGVLEFRKFVEAGGVLITLGNASAFPVEMGLTRSLGTARPSPAFYAPGPIVETEIVRPSHPVFYGYEGNRTPVRYNNGPWIRVQEGAAESEGRILMKFTGGERSVLSGLMRGADETRGQPAVLDSVLGRGRILMFVTNPCFRFYNLGEFNMLFNAILHFNDMAR